MAGAKIKKGDNVVVLSGKDKGRTGTVQAVMPKDNKVVVDGLNVIARHRKPSQQNPQGGIDRKPAPMHISKVALADPKPLSVADVQGLLKDDEALVALLVGTEKSFVWAISRERAEWAHDVRHAERAACSRGRQRRVRQHRVHVHDRVLGHVLGEPA